LRIAAIFSGFDIIIDDGSHASWHQQLTLRTLFPRLEKGGLYIIEDLHYQPPGIEALYPGTRKTRAILEDGDALAALISGVDEATIFRSPIENDNPMDTGETAIIRKSR